MKIFHRKPVYGMSFSRKEALDRCQRNSFELTRNVIKCVVYRDSTHSFDNWIQEICDVFKIVNSIVVKPSNKKLKDSDYLNTIFSSMGTSGVDAQMLLLDFQMENRRKCEFPDFEIDGQKVCSVFNSFQHLKYEITPILVLSDTELPKNFAEIVKSCLDC